MSIFKLKSLIFFFFSSFCVKKFRVLEPHTVQNDDRMFIFGATMNVDPQSNIVNTYCLCVKIKSDLRFPALCQFEGNLLPLKRLLAIVLPLMNDPGLI